MRDDDLTRILRDSEADREPPAIAPRELAARVRAAHRAQRRHRAVLAASLPIVAVLALATWRSAPNTNVEPASPPPQQVAVVTEEEIRRLEAEAAAHEQNARSLLAARSQRPSPLDDDPLADIREQIDIVAYRMILEADRLTADMRPTAAAIELYRKVERLFPATYSAEIARERLNQLSASGDS